MHFVLLLIGFLAPALGNQVTKDNRPVVNLEPLPTLMKLFNGCELFLVTEDWHLTNLNRIQRPATLYSSSKVYTSHFKSHPRFPVPVSLRAQWKKNNTVNWSIASPSLFPKPANCKAQFYFALDAGHSAHFPWVFEENESVYAYSVFALASPQRISEMNSMTMSQTLLQKSRQRALDGFSFETVQHFYHVLFPLKAETAPKADLSPRAKVLVSESFFMLSICTRCKPGFDQPVLVATNSDPALAQLSESETFKFINAIHWSFTEHMREFASIRLGALYIETGVEVRLLPLHSVLEPAFAAMVHNGTRAVLESQKVYPEDVIVMELVSRFPNASFSWTVQAKDEKDEYDDYNTVLFSKRFNEAIMGPGCDTDGKDAVANVVVTEDIALTFVTSENVTVTRRANLFFTPFDRDTWILILVCTILISATLTLFAKEASYSSTFLQNWVMIWRLYLENVHDPPTAIIRKSQFSALVILGTIVTGVVLTNGYKGVLTSDLSFAPTYAGPKDTRTLLEENWTMIPYTYSRISPDEQYHGLGRFLAPVTVYVLARNLFKKEYSPPELARYDSVFVRPEDAAYKQLLKFCRGNRTAFWIFKAKSKRITELHLPSSCSNLLSHNALMVGNDDYLPGRIGWSVDLTQRTGVVFQTIKRLVETGVYANLNRYFRLSHANFKVTHFVVKPLQQNEEEPLGLSNPLISSTFNIWIRLNGIALLLLLFEGLLGPCRIWKKC